MTGGDGFVGRRLVATLKEVLAPDARLVIAARPGLRGDPSVDHVEIDLEQPASVDHALATVRPDCVLHLAAQASVAQSHGAAASTWSVNLCGSLALARAIAAHVPAATLLFVSSAEVYGRAFLTGSAVEDGATLPVSAYAKSKLAAEGMFADVLPDTARLIVVRPANHSGPGQSDSFVLPALAAQIAAVEAGALAAIRVGNLEAARDFLHVDDVVAAYVALLRVSPTLSRRSVFNIASGQVRTIGSLLDRLRRLGTAATVVEQDPARMRPSDIAVASVDAAALTAATGWRPTRSIDSILADVLDDWRRRQGNAPADG